MMPFAVVRALYLSELLLRVQAFQHKTFAGQTLEGKLNHLVKEARELRDSHGTDPHEWADVFLLLLGALELKGLAFDDLVTFAHQKLSINETREWLPADADGCFHHKK
jgi:hypothetical protein